MHLKPVIITLFLLALAGCAVEKNEVTQLEEPNTDIAGKTDPIKENQDPVTQNIRHEAVIPILAQKGKPDEPTGSEPSDQVNYPMATGETGALVIQKHVASESHRTMQQSQHVDTSKLPHPVYGRVANDVRHAVEPRYRENYQHPDRQRIWRVNNQPVSTFSIDVDTGSYTNMRRWLNQGQLPPEDAVRVEEFINYFGYNYPPPENRDSPFQVNTEIAPTPWNTNTHLLKIGIQGYSIPKSKLPPSNLVFLIDVSGSMHSADKLPLLRQALTLLTHQLDSRDCISIVVYAGASGVVLPPIHGNRKADILMALQNLRSGGSTNGAAGIRLAYQLAQQNYIHNGINRVILATDGDFNVGMASTQELIDLVQRKRKAGIALTTLGFGTGNYNDHLLEQLADEGNGNHAYIDRLSEAQKVLAEELSATLLTIAKDVKIQVEFNPRRVSEYRLVGYENRRLNEEDFQNDSVDAGEIGAGHRVTALYEISLVGAGGQRLPGRRYDPAQGAAPIRDTTFNNELAHLRIRYKLPNTSNSRLIESPILDSGINTHGSDDFNFAAAVAAFGQKLRGGKYLESYKYHDIELLARDSRGHDPHGYRSEFMQLVSLAGTLHRTDNIALRLQIN